MKNSLFKLTLLAVLLIMASVSVSAGNTADAEPIVMGEADWPGIWVKDAVAEFILENVGYQVEIKSVKDVIIHSRLAEGEIDVYLGSWMPSAKPTRAKIEGDYNIACKNLKEGLYTLGVPQYVWEAGVKSFADLDQYADKFDRKIFAGPIGWVFTEKIKEAVDKDIYGLGDWEIVNSSQTAMIANMKRAVKKKDWIVTLAWQPHWMNYLMDIKYLEDPKNVWVSAESWVDTLTRLGFAEDRPQANKFFEQYVVNNEMSNKWIYEVGYKEKEPEKVGETWVKNNPEIVKKWLQGVKTAKGKDAYQVLQENIKFN